MKIQHMSSKTTFCQTHTAFDINPRLGGLLGGKKVTWCHNGDDRGNGSDKGNTGTGTIDVDKDFDGGGTCSIM